MAHAVDERKSLGLRLASARKLAGYTLDAVAYEMTAQGHQITKQGIGHWESGRNVPDALWLRRLAKLYETTLDALVGDAPLSAEAVRIATQYDLLDEPQQGAFKAMADTYFDRLREAQQSGKSGGSTPRSFPRKAA